MTVSKSLSKVFHWPLFIAYAVYLYFIFTTPPEKIPPEVLAANDKVLHLLLFLILALLAFRTFFYSAVSFFRAHAVAKTVWFSAAYGVFLEWAQMTVPGRSASFADWVADSLGILAAFGIVKISQKNPSPSLPV